MKKQYLILMLVLLILPMVMSMQNFKRGDVVDLKIQCIYNGTFCTPTTTCNITLLYPNDTIFVNNKVMTNQHSFFNYTLNQSQILGTYPCSTTCCDGVVCGSDNVQCAFKITTLGGDDLTTGSAMTYGIIFVVIFIIFIGLIVAGIFLPSGNKSDEMTGYIIAVNNLKYLKSFCFAFAYLVALFLSYFSWITIRAYLNMDFLSNIFQFLFFAMAIATPILFILFLYFMLANQARDAKIADALSRGLKVR